MEKWPFINYSLGNRAIMVMLCFSSICFARKCLGSSKKTEEGAEEIGSLAKLDCSSSSSPNYFLN